MWRRPGFGFGSEGSGGGFGGFDDEFEPFGRMMRQHNQIVNELLGGSQFGHPLFNDPMFGSMMGFHQSRFPSPLFGPRADRLQTDQGSHASARRGISVTEIPEIIGGEELTEEERAQVELAIAESLRETTHTQPTVTDLDDHADELRSVTGTWSPPSNDNLAFEDNDVQMFQTSRNNNQPIEIEDDEDEDLRRALEISRLEAERSTPKPERIVVPVEDERATLMAEQRQAYEDSMRRDIEKASTESFQRRWIDARRELPSEPSESDPNSTNLVVRLPNGQRLQRRFRRDDALTVVRTFIDNEIAKTLSHSSGLTAPTLPLEDPLFSLVPASSTERTYDLATDFPNFVFQDDSLTLEQASLHPRALISVRSRKP